MKLLLTVNIYVKLLIYYLLFKNLSLKPLKNIKTLNNLKMLCFIQFFESIVEIFKTIERYIKFFKLPLNFFKISKNLLKILLTFLNF